MLPRRNDSSERQERTPQWLVSNFAHLACSTCSVEGYGGIGKDPWVETRESNCNVHRPDPRGPHTTSSPWIAIQYEVQYTRLQNKRPLQSLSVFRRLANQLPCPGLTKHRQALSRGAQQPRLPANPFESSVSAIPCPVSTAWEMLAVYFSYNISSDIHGLVHCKPQYILRSRW